MVEIDVRDKSVTEVNRLVRSLAEEGEPIVIENPDARHQLCVGILARAEVTIRGSVGYFCGGLSDGPAIEVLNNAGWGLGDNLLSGILIVHQHASALAGIAMRDGTIVVKGDLGSRAGQVMKGGLILCGGRANFMAGYMAMGGRIVICGDSGRAVGQDIVAGAIYVGGRIEELGTDAEIVDMTPEEDAEIRELLDRYEISAPANFQKVASSEQLHHYSAYER
ncbi:MAG TPA: glutamate synthase, partial [Armatimonadota bacterium]|nr:glutamate synthase [Armatimonadota bacterium]